MISVTFVISVLLLASQPDAEAHFRRGVEWLHSFEYEEAIEEFRAAQKADSAFAMAYWGEAMCYSQPLWGREDVAAARAILLRLGRSPAARAAKAKTSREQGYLRAVERLFADGERLSRETAYSQAMSELAAANPSDLDAQAFYGLSVLARRPRGVIPHDQHSASGQDVAGVVRSFSFVSAKDDDVSPRAAAIFRDVLAKNPDHPGALHYVIHALDDPAHAGQAFDAARRYAQIPPAATHALHMPAHIFVQLGKWDEAAASDLAAYRASIEWTTRKKLPDSARSFHSLEWLHYEYLQLGQYQKALEMFNEIEPVAAQPDAPDNIKTMVALMRARQVIETENWESTKGQQQYRNYVELFGLGFSAARRGDFRVAEMVRSQLSQLPSDPRYQTLSPTLSILEREVAAVVEAGSGRGGAAHELLKGAVAAEITLPPSSGPAEPVKPASELLGEILLDLNRPEEARSAFEAAVRRTPGRAASIIGLARAAARAGDADDARRQYATLIERWKNADANSRVAEARAYVAGDTSPAIPNEARRAWTRPAILTAVAILIGVAALVLRSRRREPLSRQQRRRKAIDNKSS